MFRGCKRLSRPASLLLPLVEGGQDILQLLADLRYTVKKVKKIANLFFYSTGLSGYTQEIRSGSLSFLCRCI
jgi:hypothetical protein